jgi:hypothetical protein
MKFYFIIASIIIMLADSCQSDHFIKDKSYRAAVHEKFLARKELAKQRSGELFSVFNKNLSLEEKEGLEFLFAYMPLNDLTDYDGEFFYGQMKASFRAKNEMAWGKDIPDDIFRHFVLPSRVNNENLDSFRLVYYDEIKARVEGLSLKEAVLEINHWCHEKVSYQPADIRTSSPMSTIKSARGRCGEESTFTVVALRTAGIPARQVYTPRWAHSDDNHAWVEVWVDGEWHFLGACEPEPDLDMGWFIEPARRAMLVHTKAFGRYEGNEPLVKNTVNYGEINSLGRYAVTKKVTVRVMDDYSRSVKNADVRFSLFNYAEYYPLAILQTGNDGTASFLTGLGDLLVWVSKGKKYAFKKVSVEETDTMEIILKNKAFTGDVKLDMIPPVMREPLVVSNEGREENNKRLTEEDKIRNTYIATFMDSLQAADLAKQTGFDPGEVWPLIRRSEGNYKAIAEYLRAVSDDKKTFAIDLLKKVSAKDLRDVPARVFLDHLENAFVYAGKLPVENRDLLVNYVLAPRVMNEWLVDYRGFLQKALGNELADLPVRAETLVSWTNENININDEENYYDLPLSPKGVFNLRVSNRYSRKIFFIAACRSFGIPARINRVFQVPQYYENGQWKDVFFKGDESLPAQTAELKLVNGTKDKIPEYHIHFTLARIQNGVYKTLELGFGKMPELFSKDLNLPVGDYMLVTGNRMNNGGVLSELIFFHLKEGEKKSIKVKLRESSHQDADLGRMNMKSLLTGMDGKKLTLSQVAEGKKVILVWIDPDREPTKHVLNDIPLLKKNFDKMGSNLVFIVPEDKLTSSFNPETYKGLPEKSFFYKDINNTIIKDVAKEMERSSGFNLPLILIVSPEGKILYHSEGYRIGIGEHLVKALGMEG